MNRIVQLALICVFLSGCSASPVVNTAATVDISAIQTSTVQTVVASAATAAPIKPTETPIPPTATTEPVKGKEYSWNYLGEQESGGLKIQIARVDIADKTMLLSVINFSKHAIFDDKPVVVEIIFKITNTTEKEITVYPNQGTAIVSSEQVKLLDYAISGNEFGEDVSGKIYPGVTVIGGLWFGLKRTRLDDIKNMVIAIDGPFDESSMTRLGPDFRIAIDLSQRKNEPIPAELK